MSYGKDHVVQGDIGKEYRVVISCDDTFSLSIKFVSVLYYHIVNVLSLCAVPSHTKISFDACTYVHISSCVAYVLMSIYYVA